MITSPLPFESVIYNIRSKLFGTKFKCWPKLCLPEWQKRNPESLVLHLANLMNNTDLRLLHTAKVVRIDGQDGKMNTSALRIQISHHIIEISLHIPFIRSSIYWPNFMYIYTLFTHKLDQHSIQTCSERKDWTSECLLLWKNLATYKDFVLPCEYGDAFIAEVEKML